MVRSNPESQFGIGDSKPAIRQEALAPGGAGHAPTCDTENCHLCLPLDL